MNDYMSDDELFDLWVGAQDEKRYVKIHWAYLEAFNGRYDACAFISEIARLQISAGGKRNGGWVVFTNSYIEKRFFTSRYKLKQLVELLAPFGLITKQGTHELYHNATVNYYRVDKRMFMSKMRQYLNNEKPVSDMELEQDHVNIYMEGANFNTIKEVSKKSKLKDSSLLKGNGEDTQDMQQIKQQLPSSSGATPPKEDKPKLVKENSELEEFLMAQIGVTTSSKGTANLLSRERVLSNGDTYPPLEYYWKHPQYHDLLKEFIVVRAKQYLALKDVGRKATSTLTSRLLTNYDSPQGWLKFAGSKGMPLVTCEAMAEKEKPALETIFMMCYNGQQLEYRQIENEYPEFFSFYNGYEGDWDLFCAEWSSQNA